MSENTVMPAPLSGYTFRPATADDLPALAALEAGCFGDPWSEAALREHLACDCCRTLLCLADGGDLVGEVLFRVVSPEWEILRVATLPAHRRRGIGRGLMERVHAALLSEGNTNGYLEVRASGLPAQRLYAAVGYAETGLRRRYYRHPTEDAVIMTCRFPRPET